MKQVGKKKRRLSWLFIVLPLVVVALAAGGWYYFGQRAAATKTPATPALQTAKVRTGDITITASGAGNLLPASETALAFRTSGLLAQAAVKVGDRVEAGQVLARLDDADARAQVAQAEANLRLAELKLADLMAGADPAAVAAARASLCLLYTSDAADERSNVDLRGRRNNKKKKKSTTGRRKVSRRHKAQQLRKEREEVEKEE